MSRSIAPLSEVERQLRAQLKYTPRARIAMLTAALQDGLIGLGLAFGGSPVTAGDVSQPSESGRSTLGGRKRQTGEAVACLWLIGRGGRRHDRVARMPLAVDQFYALAARRAMTATRRLRVAAGTGRPTFSKSISASIRRPGMNASSR